jgi:arginine decarboxylase
MVLGQVITTETIEFMRKLDVKEIHGFNAALGLKLLKPSFLQALAPQKKIAHAASGNRGEKSAA